MPLVSRVDLEKREEEILAPYAAKSGRSRGRVHEEEEHPMRTVYQRDRDRIIHSTAFRRLEYKTQVFVNHEGDYYRTRLTHTLEVSQIARTAASILNLNVDLTEAIALAHDLGHTPFGHSGEEALKDIMKDFGGFEHNKHGLRVVDILEKRYPDFDGLNLSYEVREAIAKHTTRYDKPTVSDFSDGKQPVIEAQIVEMADSIAYDSHDLDDGLKAGLINEEQLTKIALWEKTEEIIRKKYPNLTGRAKQYRMVSSVINQQVTDLVQTTLGRIDQFGITTLDEGRDCAEPVTAFSGMFAELKKQLEDFLFDNLYKHYRVQRMASKAKRFVKELFDRYLESNELLPIDYQQRIRSIADERNKYQVICDYIAGMTDRFALDEYQKLFFPYERV